MREALGLFNKILLGSPGWPCSFQHIVSGFQLAPVGVPLAAVLGSLLVGVAVTVVAAVLPALRAARIALLTPLLSRRVVAVVGRLFSWSLPGRPGRLNSGRNPRRTAITAAALMVGVALVTGVTVVMQSAKTSLSAQTEDTIKAQVVIGGDQNGPRPPTFDGSVLAATAALPGVRSVAGLWHDQALVDGKPTSVSATDDLARLSDAYGAAGLSTLTGSQIAVGTREAAEHGWTVGSGVRVRLSRGEARE